MRRQFPLYAAANISACTVFKYPATRLLGWGFPWNGVLPCHGSSTLPLTYTEIYYTHAPLQIVPLYVLCMGGECPAKTRKILQNVAVKKKIRLASMLAMKVFVSIACVHCLPLRKPVVM